MLLPLLPVVLSLVVLGAHVYRAGSTVLVGLVLVVLALLAVRRPWAVRVVQVVLVLGAIEWLMTTAELVFERAYTGQPVARLVLILGGVAVFTAASAFVFRNERLRAAYRLRPRAPAAHR
jgi:hypothetical protein